MSGSGSTPGYKGVDEVVVSGLTLPGGDGNGRLVVRTGIEVMGGGQVGYILLIRGII